MIQNKYFVSKNVTEKIKIFGWLQKYLSRVRLANSI